MTLLLVLHADRVRIRWLSYRMSSSDPKTRRSARAGLLAIGRPAIDDVLPRLIADEAAEAVVVGGAEGGIERCVVGIVYLAGGDQKYYEVLSWAWGRDYPTDVFEWHGSPLGLGDPRRAGNAPALEAIAMTGHRGLGVAKTFGYSSPDALLLLAPLPDDLAPEILDAVKRRLPPRPTHRNR